MASVTSALPSSLHLALDSTHPMKSSSGSSAKDSYSLGRKSGSLHVIRSVHSSSTPRVPPSVFAPPRKSPPATHLSGRGREPLAPAAAIALVDNAPPYSNASISNLRDKISHIESKMANLMSERNLLVSRLAQAARLQSPIHRIPDELLAQIFTVAVFDVEEEDPLMLSTVMLVSKRFREVAIKTPVLWSRVVISNHNSLESARRKLSRSKSAPIHVCIDFDPQLEQGGSTTQTVVHAMDILKPSIYRWKSFRLHVPTRPQAHAALGRCQEDAPLLEHLSIHIGNSLQEEHFLVNLPLFNGHTPRLHCCSFVSFNFAWDLRIVSALRTLKLDGYWNASSPSVVVVLDILRACPGLEEFSLRNMSDVDPDTCVPYDYNRLRQTEYPDDYIPPLPAHPVHLTHLRKMAFHCAGMFRVRAIMGQLVFPALESMELCYMHNASSVFKFLQRQALASLPLKHLRIESTYFSELTLLRLLRKLSSLTVLEMVDVEDISSEFLKGLSAPPPAQSWVCPHLEVLNLEACSTVEWDALRVLVESRVPAHVRSYARQIQALPPSTPSVGTSSASIQALQRMSSRSLSAPPCDPMALGWPKRLKSIDLSRCHQISKEMIQWLRIRIPDVKFDKPRGVWGEALA